LDFSIICGLLFKGKLKLIDDFMCSWLIHSNNITKPSSKANELLDILDCDWFICNCFVSVVLFEELELGLDWLESGWFVKFVGFFPVNSTFF